jgi:hypothetical protein
MNEADANQQLLDSVRMKAIRLTDDPLEQTQRMPVWERRRRQTEGRVQRAVGLNIDWINESIQRELTDLLGIKVTADTLLNADFVDIERRMQANYHGSVQQGMDGYAMGPTEWPDFRDGRREYRLTPNEIAQQDGFSDNE